MTVLKTRANGFRECWTFQALYFQIILLYSYFSNHKYPFVVQLKCHCFVIDRQTDISCCFNIRRMTVFAHASPGSEKAHERNGCVWCGSAHFCQPQDYDLQCPCDWHCSERLRQANATETTVRKYGHVYASQLFCCKVISCLWLLLCKVSPFFVYNIVTAQSVVHQPLLLFYL